MDQATTTHNNNILTITNTPINNTNQKGGTWASSQASTKGSKAVYCIGL